MYRVLESITREHDYGVLFLAVVTCVVGSALTVLLSRRMLSSRQRLFAFQLSLASIIGGATMWSTHFLAMLAFDPGIPHGYDMFATLLSLVLGAAGMLFTNLSLRLRSGPSQYILTGVMFGLTVSAMHYMGMLAYLIPGVLVWDSTWVALSVAIGSALGVLAFHRIVHPRTKYCWMGGAAGLVFSIFSMHFTGMVAFQISYDPSIVTPTLVISDLSFGIFVSSIAAILYLTGYFSFGIETENMDRLEQAALHDQLTQLPNRAHLAVMIDKIASRTLMIPRPQIAVLTIDLNFFKQANDLYGHAAGDQILTTLGERLIKIRGNSDFIARTGGDEFVAIYWGWRRVEQVKDYAETLHSLITAPIRSGPLELSVGAAIGIAITNDETRDTRTLLHQSDLAMYRAKRRMDTNICLFDAELDQQNRDKIKVSNDLRGALARNEFELAYQMQTDLATSDITGFEVLLRWNHPDDGRVSPDKFIPIAEETGAIREIGMWVLRSACREAARWPGRYTIAVNVAPQQMLEPTFVDQVALILDETGLDPALLELEITEASVIDDQTRVRNVMVRLNEMGVRIAMDDFGTGYSSLATLQAFPFDKIKIDRSFITDVHRNRQSAAIVRSTLLLGSALDIPVLAEGVEVSSELEFLRQERCHAVQGFYFGRPMSVAELRRLLFARENSKVS